MVAEYEQPFIFLTDQKITNLKDILPILEQLQQRKMRSLIVILSLTSEVKPYLETLKFMRTILNWKQNHKTGINLPV
jgi:chaperonin GroEL